MCHLSLLSPWPSNDTSWFIWPIFIIIIGSKLPKSLCKLRNILKNSLSNNIILQFPPLWAWRLFDSETQNELMQRKMLQGFDKRNIHKYQKQENSHWGSIHLILDSNSNPIYRFSTFLGNRNTRIWYLLYCLKVGKKVHLLIIVRVLDRVTWLVEEICG
jgi:hypothetical protein